MIGDFLGGELDVNAQHTKIAGSSRFAVCADPLASYHLPGHGRKGVLYAPLSWSPITNNPIYSSRVSQRMMCNDISISKIAISVNIVIVMWKRGYLALKAWKFDRYGVEWRGTIGKCDAMMRWRDDDNEEGRRTHASGKMYLFFDHNAGPTNIIQDVSRLGDGSSPLNMTLSPM